MKSSTPRKVWSHLTTVIPSGVEGTRSATNGNAARCLDFARHDPHAVARTLIL